MSKAEAMRAWVKNWQRVGPELEELRREEIRAADTEQAIAVLSDAIDQALSDLPPRPSSGLVEQQFWFAKQKR